MLSKSITVVIEYDFQKNYVLNRNRTIKAKMENRLTKRHLCSEAEHALDGERAPRCMMVSLLFASFQKIIVIRNKG